MKDEFEAEKINIFKGKKINIKTISSYSEFSAHFDENVEPYYNFFKTLSSDRKMLKGKNNKKNKKISLALIRYLNFHYPLMPSFYGKYIKEKLVGKISIPMVYIFFPFMFIWFSGLIFGTVCMIYDSISKHSQLDIHTILLILFMYLFGIAFIMVAILLAKKDIKKLEEIIKLIFER